MGTKQSVESPRSRRQEIDVLSRPSDPPLRSHTTRRNTETLQSRLPERSDDNARLSSLYVPHTSYHNLRPTSRNTHTSSPPPSQNQTRPPPRPRDRPLPPIPFDAEREQRILDMESFLLELGLDLPPRPSRPPPLSHTSHSHQNVPEGNSIEDLNRRRRSRRRAESSTGSSHHRLNRDDPLELLRQLTRRRCPVCSQEIPSFEYQSHLSTCVKPHLTIQYNEDTLTMDAGECTICLEDMTSGDEIARLPCLCVYHIKCIEEWFKVKELCPQHPDLKMPLS